MTFRVLLDQISKNLGHIARKLELGQIKFSVEPAKEGFGDVSCNIAFLAAKKLHKPPYQIASQLAQEYQKYVGDIVEKVEAHPSGYLNFYANYEKLCRQIIVATQNPEYGAVNVGQNSPVVVEHTSVNPNKALHIGHVRNVVIGDCIARILSKSNYNVKTLNYIDDSGLQVADIIVGFKYLGFSENPPPGVKFDQYCGDVVYVKTTEKYSSEPALEEKRRQILKELEDETSETAKFARRITRMVLADQLKTCWRLGAYYDCINFESEIVRSKLWQQVFEKLKEMKLIKFQTEGKNKDCWVIPADGQDKVLVRSNGTATYIAKDIPYAAWKLGMLHDPFYYEKYTVQENNKTLWQTTLQQNNLPKLDFTADCVITVIDSRQSRLQNIITNLISKFAQNKKYIHLRYESVTLSPQTAAMLGVDTGGKAAHMSGRRGLYVNADFVLDELQKKTLKETRVRNPDLAESELQEIAKKVAVATIRYEMAKQDLDKIITFDAEKSLSLEGDTASYIQYSYARAVRIIEKAGTLADFGSASYGLLQTPYEINLVKLIGKFDLNVEDAAKNLSPKVIAKYCYNLAVSFNAFYEHQRVIDVPDPNLRQARLCLVFAFKSCVEKALYLIGIQTPKRM